MLEGLLNRVQVDFIELLAKKLLTLRIIWALSGSYMKFPSDPAEPNTFPTALNAPPFTLTLPTSL